MLNVVVLTGRLVADPELKHTASDLPVSSFTIAVNRRFSRNGEERQTDFIDIVAWRSNAEFVCKYFKKGQQVSIIGRIQTRTWDDENGQKRYVTEVIAEEAHFAESKRQDNASDFESGFNAQMTQSGSSAEGFTPVVDDTQLPF